MTRDEQIELIKRSLAGANLRGADLSGTNLSWNDLSGANLRGADLRGADLSGASLSGADLSGADLRGADLGGTDLSGADLGGTDLSGAYLRYDIKILRLIARLYRHDNYMFFGFQTNRGLIIKAGCHLMSSDDYRSHIAKEYPGTPKAKETLAIIKYLEDLALDNH